MRLPILLIVAFLVACGGVKAKPSTKVDLNTLNVDGDHRLENDVVPTHYTLNLEVDPAKERFSGKVAIKVALANTKQVFRMHGRDLDISSSKITTIATKETLVATVVKGKNDGIALVLDKPIAAGNIVIELDYSAPLAEEPSGLYRVKDEGQWYAYTQFEPLDARKAFPSFDEPRFKTPFLTTIKAPAGQIAVANTPGTHKENTFSFEESKKMPTYLVAFAVGEFEIVPAAEGAIPNVPFRVITTKGKGKLASYMLGKTPQILAALSDYFGETYPYKKLDVIAVPNFSAGAMENVGLVTFRETLLLLDPQTASIGQKRSAMNVMAHELAHMWFGNLVTMEWWDDLWLNEAFATWMARKMTHKIMPELEIDISAINTRGWITATDSQVATRAIRHPIKVSGDVMSAFDGLTYYKGAAVIEMFETWVGEEPFKIGVRNYLKKYTFGSATTDEFFAEIDAATNVDLGKKMKTFLDQPGVPLLNTSLTCEANAEKKNIISINLSQSRYLPHGSKASPEKMPWSAPFCVRYEEKGKTKVHCDVIDAKTKKVELETTRCPRWYYPNANETGYYIWEIPDADLKMLTKRYISKLTIRERVGLFSNIEALLSARSVTPETYVESVKTMAKEKHKSLVSRTVGTMNSFDRILGDERSKTRFSRRAKSLLSRHMNRVGYKKKKAEKIEKTIMRPSLLSSMASIGEDKRANKLASKMTADFFKDPNSVPGEFLGFALSTTAQKGDEKLWNAFKAAFDTTKNPAQRRSIVGALGNFENPILRDKSLALFLDGTLRSQDFGSLVYPMFDAKSYPALWDWFTKNYDKILGILGKNSATRMPRFGGGFCDEAGKAKVVEFFSKASGRVKPGSERSLTNVLGEIDQCISERAYLKDAVMKFSK